MYIILYIYTILNYYYISDIPLKVLIEIHIDTHAYVCAHYFNMYINICVYIFFLLRSLNKWLKCSDNSMFYIFI